MENENIELSPYYHEFLDGADIEIFNYLPKEGRLLVIEKLERRYGRVPENYGTFELHEDYSDVESLDGSFFEGDDEDTFESRNSHEIAPNVRMDVLNAYNYEELSFRDYSNSAVREFQVSQSNGNNFRNLVFTLYDTSSGYPVTRHMSISRAGFTIFMGKRNITDEDEALREILAVLYNGSFQEIWEDYEVEPVLDFRLATHKITIVYEHPTIMGGGQITEFSCKFLDYYPARKRYSIGFCILDCIHQILARGDNVFDERLISRKFKINSKTLIAQKHLPYIEKMFKINIDVYLDELEQMGKNSPQYYYKSPRKYDKNIYLVLENRHYFIFSNVIDTISENFMVEDDSELPNEYLFYDLETYMHPEKYDSVIYTLNYLHTDMNGAVKDSKIIVKDCDKDDLDEIIYKFFSNFYEGKRNVYLVGFNNGSFDDYMLIRVLMKYAKTAIKTMIDANNRILQFQWGRLKSKDLNRFLNTSLRDALSGFGCNVQKGDLDHKKVQLAVENNKFSEFMQDNIAEVVKYGRGDVFGLRELYFKVRKTFLDIDAAMDINKFLTLSQMSMKAFKKKFKEEFGADYTLVVLDKKMDDYVRQALVGGKTRVYGNKKCDDVLGVDCTSLYPYNMMTNEYAYVKKKVDSKGNKKQDRDVFREVDNYFPGDRGFYHIKVLTQPEENIYPKRNEDLTWDWEYKEEFETHTDHIRLEYFIKCGGTYEFLGGYKFKDKVLWSPFFNEYMQKIKAMKIQQDCYKETKDSRYNKVLRECLKLILNSLSGKMTQKPFIKERVILNTKAQRARMEKLHRPSYIPIDEDAGIYLAEWENADDEVEITSSTVNGIFIYSYAQRHMHEKLLSRISSEYKYTTDTDSLFFHRSQQYLIEDIIGKDFGGFKYETEPQFKHEGYFPAKKIYTVFRPDLGDGDENKIVKYKFKGVRAKDYLVYSDEMAEKLRQLIKKKDYKQVNEISEALPTFQNNINTIEMLCDKSKVHVLCYQIRRSIQDVKIKGMFVLKEFDIHKNLKEGL